MVYGYLRVSSDDQTVENQKVGVVQFANTHEWTIDGYIIDDGVSGTKDPSKRQLGKLLGKVKENDIIICSEISRLGRNLLMIMSILQMLMQKKAMLYTVKDNYVLGDNIQSTVLAFAFGLAAQIERDMISMRTKEALARKRAEGVILGRPVGRKTTPSSRKLYPKENLIRELLENGTSKRQIAKICHVDRNTLDRYIKDFKLNKQEGGVTEGQ